MSSKYGDFRNTNRYGHKALVVLKFEEVNVDGRPQVYATGFDLERPDQKISIALMQEEGYRKNIAQVSFGLVEKNNGNETQYFNTQSGKQISKEDYEQHLHHGQNINQEFDTLIKQRAKAEGLLAKRLRIGKLPAVLMFDNANKIGEIGGIEIHEARWVSGLSGNTNRIEADQKLEDDFAVSHRKVLGNIRVKYDDHNNPVWGDCNAIDRIVDLKAPTPTNTPEENQSLSLRNRDILRYALSNTTTSDEGYKVERKPFTYVNLIDTKGEVNQTISIRSEEVADSRHKNDDPIVKYNFQRPEDAPVTLEAYMFHNDSQTKALSALIASGSEISSHHKYDIKEAYAADKARAVICSLMNLKFTPIITPDLAQRAVDKDVATDISIKANDLKSFHRKLVMGELSPRMINGTVYPLGPKYLQRFVDEVQITNRGGQRPMRGLVEMKPFPEVDGVRNRNEKIVSHAENKLIFSEMYICPKKWETTSENPSVFTGLITTPAQSHAAVLRGRILHTELQESHSPSADSYRFIALEYKDYINGTKEMPSIVNALKEERDRIDELSKTNDASKEYEKYYRLTGVHKVPESTAQNTRSQQYRSEAAPTDSFDMS